VHDLDFTALEVSDLNNMLMALALSFCRVLTFIIASPFFNSRSVTRIVRTGLTMALALMLTPMTYEQVISMPDFQARFFSLAVKELLLGMVLGGLVWMPIRGLEFAGVLLDTQRGSTMAQDYNVIFASPQATPTAIFLTQMFSGFFFAIGGMLIVTQVVFQSTVIWPLTDPLPNLQGDIAYLYGVFAATLIFSAVVFALPISGFMLLADIGIAFLAKGAPTLNALTFGMPVKSAILLIMLFFYLGIAFPQIMESFGESLDFLTALLSHER